MGRLRAIIDQLLQQVFNHDTRLLVGFPNGHQDFVRQPRGLYLSLQVCERDGCRLIVLNSVNDMLQVLIEVQLLCGLAGV